MDWRAMYVIASERHRQRARGAREAQRDYAAALHRRVAELLQAELVFGAADAGGVETVAVPKGPFGPTGLGSAGA